MSKKATYDEQIRSLMDECRQLSATRDPRALPALSRLKRIAEGTGDPGLGGFVHFHTANYHYISADYDAFHKSLGQAIRLLLRSDEYDLLARTFNFFAIEAYSKGALDVAYNYYMSALEIVDNQPDSGVRWLLLINLAGLFSRLENYAEARRYFKKGIAVLKKGGKDLFYQRNLLAAYMIDGLNSIAMGDIGAAEKAYRKATGIRNSADASLIREMHLAYAMFEARLALSMRETKTVRERSRAIAESLGEEEALYEVMDDIRDFCRILIEAGYLTEAGRIIEAVDARVMAGDVTHAMFQLTEMKVDYYDRLHDEENLMKSLTEQNRLFLRSQKEQQELRHYSIEYVKLVEELKTEEELVRRENEVLQEQVLNDELCGIPNRYAMDRELERAFERAYAARTTLGISLLDVNRFKEVNDTCGHQAGDRYLSMIGRVLKKAAEDENVFCARYGGDEFLVIYEGMRDEDILKKARAIGRAIAKRKVTVKGKPVGAGVTVSQGICSGIPYQKTKTWDYLSEADAALYEAKKNRGRNEGIALRGLRGRHG
ncbi:MAG: GGDEF domain-containing protein [Lachnospiraceae bacterium]|nr:GGDEF domain-containing protein [Lachnospiraceae bacterium]